MDVLADSWRDPDRRDAALERLAARIKQPVTLSHSELAVVFLVSHGMRHAEIADTLGIRLYTVRTYARMAQRKLQAKTPTHTVATALRLGLIS